VFEERIQHPDPVQLAALRARAKATALRGEFPSDTWIIGADQVVCLEDRVLGKPACPSEHLRMLQDLCGRWHQLVTAVVLLSCGDEQGREFQVRTRLRMRADLEDEELRAYVACGEARACGGGYMVEGKGIQLFSDIEGDWTNIIGLPLVPLIDELRALGWRFEGSGPASCSEP